MATTLNCFLVARKRQKNSWGCRRDSWRQPKNSCCQITRKIEGLSPWVPATTINFLFRSLPLKLVQNLNIAGFLGKNWKKMPIKKKLVYSTLLVRYVTKPMSVQNKKKFQKNSTPPLMPHSALWPIIGGQGGFSQNSRNV